MNENSTSLDRLHDLVTPPPVPWWPPAPGWAIVLALFALLLLAVLLKVFMHWQANRYRREALAMLENTPPAGLSALLKRVALTVWPREEVADLTGEPWLQFLDRTGSMNLFAGGAGKHLESVAFNPAADAGAPDLRRAAREWIQKHRREEGGSS